MNERLTLTRAIDQARIDAYASASGDHNPLHVNPAFAASTPFQGTIAHGMLVLALIGEMMHTELGGAWLERARLKVRFKAPARPGDIVTATAELVRRDGDELAYDVRCANQRGETLIEGRATAGAVA